MSALLKLMLRLFAFAAGWFGLAMGLVAGIVTWHKGLAEASLWAGGSAVAAGVLFGLVAALTLGGMHAWYVRRLGYPLTDESLSVCQRRRLTLDVPIAEAFSLCIESARHFVKFDVEEETDLATGVILIRQRWQFARAGGQLRFDLRQTAAGGGTEVVVESRPQRRAWASVDDGTSLRCVDAIVGFLLTHGARIDATFGAMRSEHLRATTPHVEGRPTSVREGGDGPSPRL